MRKLLYLMALTIAAYVSPAVASAQTKFSGTCLYRPSERHMLVVGDRDGHALGVSQGKCDWKKPIDFGGDKAKDGVATDTIDAESLTASYNGVLVLTTQRGDRISLVYHGTGESNGVVGLAHQEGTFAFADGTGKLKHATGKGTFRCAKTPEGHTCDFEGKYQAGK